MKSIEKKKIRDKHDKWRFTSSGVRSQNVSSAFLSVQTQYSIPITTYTTMTYIFVECNSMLRTKYTTFKKKCPSNVLVSPLPSPNAYYNNRLVVVSDSR